MTDLSTWAEIDTERMIDEIEAAHGSTFFDSWSRLDPARAVREIETELGVTLSPFDVLDPRSLVLRVEDALSDGGGDEQTLLASLLAAGDSFHAPSFSASSSLTAGLVSDGDSFGAPTLSEDDPLSYVQGKSHLHGSAFVTSVGLDLDAPAQEGSALIVGVGYASPNGTVTSVTDDADNVYTIQDTIHDASAGYTWVIATTLVGSTTPLSIVATLSDSFSFTTMIVDEVANVTGVRSHAAQLNTNPGAVTDGASSGNASAVVGDWVHGIAVNIDGNGLSAGTGFTIHQNVGSAFATEHKIADATTVAATFTPGGAGDVPCGVVVLH